MRFTHRHADGGLYSYQGPQAGKDPATGDWLDGVCYIGEDGKPRWTDKKRWNERFTELPPGEVIAQTTVESSNVKTDFTLAYHFTLEQAGDVFHLLMSAAQLAGKQRDHRVESVLRAQADMIEKGLHLRDLDVPDMVGDVAAFHQKFGQEYRGKPRMLPADLHDFRVKFHEEETTEYKDEYPKLVDAVARQDQRDIVNSLELQLDALCDAAWVILGTADLQFGKPAFYAAWRRVVIANMAKVRADADPDALDSGREAKYDIRKPAGWKAPDHRDLVIDHAHQIYRKEGTLPADTRSDTQVVPTAQ